jgi:hypothetical protein
VALQQPLCLLHSCTARVGKPFNHFKCSRSSLCFPPRRFLVAPLAAEPNRSALESFLLEDGLESKWKIGLLGLNALSAFLFFWILEYNTIKFVSDFPNFSPSRFFSFSIDCYVLYQLTKKPWTLI